MEGVRIYDFKDIGAKDKTHAKAIAQKDLM